MRTAAYVPFTRAYTLLQTLLVAGAALTAAPAQAQAIVPPVVACGDHAKIAAHLLEKYGEAPAAIGLGMGGRVLYQLYASPGGKTWTLVQTLPSGQACPVAAGENWETLPVPSTDPEA